MPIRSDAILRHNSAHRSARICTGQTGRVAVHLNMFCRSPTSCYADSIRASSDVLQLSLKPLCSPHMSSTEHYKRQGLSHEFAVQDFCLCLQRYQPAKSWQQRTSRLQHRFPREHVRGCGLGNVRHLISLESRKAAGRWCFTWGNHQHNQNHGNHLLRQWRVTWSHAGELGGRCESPPRRLEGSERRLEGTRRTGRSTLVRLVSTKVATIGPGAIYTRNKDATFGAPGLTTRNKKLLGTRASHRRLPE